MRTSGFSKSTLKTEGERKNVEEEFTYKNLSGVQTPVYVAEEVGARLGKCEILQREMQKE
ncbi:MAG: hypothetical protein U5K35_08995 [Rhodohalobacter sp.]|nr:hypothetical protein [Rhodohalobacter sp.]MDZ7756531.1 hypothetical protein [Rhodohalobacter sp.]